MAKFKRNVGNPVERRDCVSWADSYHNKFPGETRSVFYGRDAIEKILSNQSLSGISFFFCRKVNAEGKPYNDLILVGTYEDGTLDWGKGDDAEAMRGSNGGFGYNNGVPCPPDCPNQYP